MSRNFMMMLFIIVIFFIVIDIIPLFMGRPYHFENSKLVFEFSTTSPSTLTSSVLIYMKKSKRIQDLVRRCEESKSSDESERNMQSLFGNYIRMTHYECEAKTKGENEVILKETYGLDGLVREEGKEYIISFGKKIKRIPVTTTIVYILPENSQVTYASPTSETSGTVLRWSFEAGSGMVFPEVKFTLGE